MRRALPILALLVFLPACGLGRVELPAPDPLRPSQVVYHAELRFQEQAARAMAYIKQEPCDPAVRVVACADPEVSAVLNEILTKGDKALTTAWALYRAGRDPRASIVTVRLATSTILNALLVRRQ